MIRGVIFDLGGTLTARVRLAPDVLERANASALRAWLREHGYRVGEEFVGAVAMERLKKFAERARGAREILATEALKPVLERFGLPAGDEFLALAERAFFEPEMGEMRLLPGSRPLLEKLAGEDIRQGLASNASSHYFVVECCRRLDLDRYFDPIQSSAAVGWVKPHPMIFQTILNTWQLQPADVVMVGDNLGADIAGARAAGMRSILVTGERDPADPMPSDSLRPEGVAIDLEMVSVILDAWK